MKLESKRKYDISKVVIKTLSFILVTLSALVCVIPFYLIVAASFTSEQEIIRHGFSFIPGEFSTSAYELVFRVPQTIIQAYGVSFFVTLIGTGLGLFLTAMMAYVLSRSTCRYKNHMAFFIYFTTLFSGGMIPGYIWITQFLHLKDTIWVLILPLMLGSWNILLMRNFMKGIPEDIAEAATIDGASEFQVFYKLYFPLSKAGLATIGLFIALSYWNNWYQAMLYVNNSDLYPLQYLLYNMQSSMDGIKQAAALANVPEYDMPAESFKMAMAVVATGPIVLLYPFVQKYFVKGLTVGAVKG